MRKVFFAEVGEVMEVSGGQIVINILKEHNVDTVFGYPGATVLAIYDALYFEKSIKHILSCHEQHAVHAAHGYSMASGKTGVVIATSGPGATNLVTGIATAHMDSVPLVVITGNVELKNLGKDSFQEVDIAGITSPITKHNVIVKDIGNLANSLRDAFLIANSGRKGPVLVDIPKDITNAMWEYTKKEPQKLPNLSLYKKNDITLAVKALNKSKKPFILAGGGTKYFRRQLEEFAHKLNAPLGVTLMGIGSYTPDENYMGLTGINGTKAAAMCMKNCDLLIGIGTRFSQKVLDIGLKGEVLHIDIDEAEINKNIHADYQIIGDGGEILEKLIPHIKTKSLWEHAIADRGVPPYPRKLITHIQKYAPKDAIYTTDVGLHQLWAAKTLVINNSNMFITSGGLGTMGFGLGSAIGSAVATGKECINITGDGSFYMSMQEIATAVTYDLPVKIIIFDNQSLGLVKEWQKKTCEGRYCQTDNVRKTDYIAFAKAMGAEGVKIKKGEEEKLKEAFLKKGCVLIHCEI